MYWWGKNDNLNNESMAHSVQFRTAGSGSDHNATNPYSEDDPRYYSFLRPALDAAHQNATQDYDNVRSAIEFLRARDAASPPFMIFLPILLPHPPYSCPEPWYSMVDPADVAMRRPLSNASHAKPDYHALLRNYTHQDRLVRVSWPPPLSSIHHDRYSVPYCHYYSPFFRRTRATPTSCTGRSARSTSAASRTRTTCSASCSTRSTRRASRPRRP